MINIIFLFFILFLCAVISIIGGHFIVYSIEKFYLKRKINKMNKVNKPLTNQIIIDSLKRGERFKSTYINSVGIITPISVGAIFTSISRELNGYTQYEIMNTRRILLGFKREEYEFISK